MNKLTDAAYKKQKNFSLGEGTRAESEWMGRQWVGEGYTVNLDGRWGSSDGLREYRPPSAKDTPFATTGMQSNIERRSIAQGEWEHNGHLNITDEITYPSFISAAHP
jgi:hypothetical protein